VVQAVEAAGRGLKRRNVSSWRIGWRIPCERVLWRRNNLPAGESEYIEHDDADKR